MTKFSYERWEIIESGSAFRNHSLNQKMLKYQRDFSEKAFGKKEKKHHESINEEPEPHAHFTEFDSIVLCDNNAVILQRDSQK